MKRKLCIFAALFVALFLLVPFVPVSAETGGGIELFTDKDRTQAAGNTLTVRIGEARTDLYYLVGCSAETALTAVAGDESIVQVIVLSGRIGFVATAGQNRAGTTDVVISAESGVSVTLSVTTDYALPGTVGLTTDGEKPGAINRTEIGAALTVEYGIPFPVYVTGLDSRGNSCTVDPEMQYVWTFDDNTCGAAFVPAEGKAEAADVWGTLTVTGAGSASASVTMYRGGEPVGTPKTFVLTAVYQQMAADVNIRANDIFITGMRYTAGSDKITLVYQENGKNLSEEVPLSDVKMDYTVSNQQYLDPTDVVWSSTDASVVKVENGAIVFGENISGAKQVTITVTNKDKTVMDSFLVVVSGASAPEEGEGCGSSVAGSAGGTIAAAALLWAAVAVMRRAKRG